MMIGISHEILIQHYDMYLVCCEIFLKFLKFSGRCCGPDKLLVSRATTLDVAVQYVAEIFFGGHCFTVLSIVSSKLCTMNLIMPWNYIYAANCTNKKLILDLSSSFFLYSWSFHLLENIKIVQVLYKFLTSKLITGSTINSEISL